MYEIPDIAVYTVGNWYRKHLLHCSLHASLNCFLDDFQARVTSTVSETNYTHCEHEWMSARFSSTGSTHCLHARFLARDNERLTHRKTALYHGLDTGTVYSHCPPHLSCTGVDDGIRGDCRHGYSHGSLDHANGSVGTMLRFPWKQEAFPKFVSGTAFFV